MGTIQVKKQVALDRVTILFEISHAHIESKHLRKIITFLAELRAIAISKVNKVAARCIMGNIISVLCSLTQFIYLSANTPGGNTIQGVYE